MLDVKKNEFIQKIYKWEFFELIWVWSEKEVSEAQTKWKTTVWILDFGLKIANNFFSQKLGARATEGTTKNRASEGSLNYLKFI